MTVERNFFHALSEQVRATLNLAIEEKEGSWLSFAKRRTEVLLCAPGADGYSGKADLRLHFLGYEVLSEADGTFMASSLNDELLVFRMPSKISVSYLLNFSALELSESLRIFDRLGATFFNRKAMEAFVPQAFKAVPELYARMDTGRAEIALKKAGTAIEGGYEMRFEYKGLYHSGDPIRTEKRVKQRVVHMKSQEGNL